MPQNNEKTINTVKSGSVPKTEKNSGAAAQCRLFAVMTEQLESESVFGKAYRQVCESRRKKVDAILPPEEKRRSLAAGFAAKTALSASGMSDSDILYTDLGMPRLRGDSGLRISISHSGSCAVCAVSPCRIGADVERVMPFSERLRKIADRCFAENERTLLSTVLRDGGEDEFVRLFCSVWTCRESYMKLTGLGFTEPRDSFAVHAEGGSIYVKTADGATLPIRQYAVDGHILSLCSETPLFPENIEYISI